MTTGDVQQEGLLMPLNLPLGLQLIQTVHYPYVGSSSLVSWVIA
jgi:hypothetical protein